MIIVGGEALFDLVPARDGAAETLAALPGGGPFNTARTLARLARPASYLGRLSNDAFGERLVALLREDGVGLDAVARTDAPTTLALVELDDGGSAVYRFYSEGTSAPGLSVADALAAVAPGVEALHVGTLGLVYEPIAAALEAAAARAADAGVLVMVDPNCRPAAIGDPDAYRARLGRVLARADVVKVSEEDLGWLSPGVEARRAARELLAGGPSVVLLTRGGDGAVAVSDGAEAEVPGPPADVVDTIGAGDAFSGGWLAWWSEHALGRAGLGDAEAVARATRFACLVAAKTCERPGASPPWRDELGAG